MEYAHLPVMLNEVISYLAPSPGKTIMDCTLGGAGHSLHIARALGPTGTLVGLDRDGMALRAAAKALNGVNCRIRLVQADFADIRTVADDLGIYRLDGVLFDFGVSSHQLDTAERGFSYKQDAPLDMRLDASRGITAQDIVNQASLDELTAIIRDYGEERWAVRIARFIVETRGSAPIRTTGDLVKVIEAAVPKGARQKGMHPARRTFQALRIAVNGELDSIRRAVPEAIDMLSHNGRITAISYHSLEDRIVKDAFREAENPCICPSSLPVCVCRRTKKAEVLTRRPVTPSRDEVMANPRARSAKLRAVRRVLAPMEAE